MLLELPPDLQQKVLSHLTVTDKLTLRFVNHGHRDLATTSIDSLKLPSVCHLAEINDAFPSVTQLKLEPRDAQQVVHMSLAFQTGWHRVTTCPHYTVTPTKLPRALTQLEIDTGNTTFETLRCYEVSNAVQHCPALQEIHLSAYAIEMTADDDFLQKVVSLKTIQKSNPPYPPACFLPSGLFLPNRLQRCTRLRELITYTRSDHDTLDLVESLNRHPTLEILELFVPCLAGLDSAIKAVGAQFPQVQELVLIDQQHRNSAFPFDLQAFPELKDLVVSLASQGYTRASVQDPHHNLPKLETAFLGNVADLTPLRWADNLVTLNLSYSAEYVSEPLPDLATTFSALPLIPNLRTLEISNGEIAASVVVACPKLENVILSDTIGRFLGILFVVQDFYKFLTVCVHTQMSSSIRLPTTSRTLSRARR